LKGKDVSKTEQVYIIVVTAMDVSDSESIMVETRFNYNFWESKRQKKEHC